MDARHMARALGRRGGRARARRLSPSRKKQIAALGGTARARSLEVARRIAENFRYARAVEALAPQSRKATGRKDVHGRLPGIYPPQV